MFDSEQLSAVIANLAAAPTYAKIIVFFIAWLVLWLPLAVPLAIALKWQPSQPITVTQKLPLLASLYLIVPVILWAATLIEATSFEHYGLSLTANFFLSLVLGLLIGAIGLLIVFGIEQQLGWIVWQNSWMQVRTVILPTLLLALWVSITEELIFRGFLVNQLQQDYSVMGAAVISSLIFAILHLVWEGQENIPQLPGLWLMGMVLVLARGLEAGSLGLACGLHAGWIWAMASLDSANLIGYTGRGSQWLTGKDNKPLAGIVGLCFLLSTGVLLWVVRGILPGSV